jgi:hypothetical protein
MNFMNPQVSIEISRGVIHSKNEWLKAVEAQVKQTFKKINRPFSQQKFEDAVNSGRPWRLTVSGIDFNVKTV